MPLRIKVEGKTRVQFTNDHALSAAAAFPRKYFTFFSRQTHKTLTRPIPYSNRLIPQYTAERIGLAATFRFTQKKRFGGACQRRSSKKFFGLS